VAAANFAIIADGAVYFARATASLVGVIVCSAAAPDRREQPAKNETANCYLVLFNL
jgi:hypothetical protein